MKEYDDYPIERCNSLDTNKEMVCFFCKTPVSQINGKLENHKSDCKYRIKKETA